MLDGRAIRTLRRHVGTALLLGLVLLVLIAYILYPSLRVVWESLQDRGAFSLRHYRTFFSLKEFSHIEALLHSLYISAGSVVLAALVGVPLAFVFTRYEFPGRPIFAALAVFPIALPPLVGVISFLFLYGESGMIPRGLQAILGLDRVPFAVDGVPAIFLVHAYTMYVYFYLFVSAALSGMESSTVEAAANLGGSRFFVFRKVTLPLLIPALVGAALLVFMTSMASFTAPLVFAGGYRVLSLQIYFSKLNGDMEMAITQTVVLATFSMVFLLVLRWYSGRRRYQMAGKGTRGHRRTIRGGRIRFLVGALGIVGVIILMLPHLTIVLLSFVKDGTWTWQVLPPSYTVENYLRLFRDPRIMEPILNSLKMAGLATSGNLIFGVLAAYLLAKRVFPGKSIVEVLVMLPWALPGTVVAIHLIVAFNEGTVFSGGQILVGTFWILPLAYFVRHIPLVVRSSYAALEQFDTSLEEAARNLGASWGRAFRKVVLPAILPGVFAGTLIAFVSALGEFVSSILLYISTNRPISVEIWSQLRLFNFGSAAAYGVFLILLISATLLFSHKVLGVRSQRAFV